MENLTIVGMKELSNRVFKIEHSLESIAKSLETLVKIQNKQIPPNRITTGYSFNALKEMEESLKDEEMEED